MPMFTNCLATRPFLLCKATARRRTETQVSHARSVVRDTCRPQAKALPRTRTGGTRLSIKDPRGIRVFSKLAAPSTCSLTCMRQKAHTNTHIHARAHSHALAQHTHTHTDTQRSRSHNMPAVSRVRQHSRSLSTICLRVGMIHEEIMGSPRGCLRTSSRQTPSGCKCIDKKASPHIWSATAWSRSTIWIEDWPTLCSEDRPQNQRALRKQSMSASSSGAVRSTSNFSPIFARNGAKPRLSRLGMFGDVLNLASFWPSPRHFSMSPSHMFTPRGQAKHCRNHMVGPHKNRVH